MGTTNRQTTGRQYSMFVICLLIVGFSLTMYASERSTPSVADARTSIDGDAKIILLWSAWFGKPSWFFADSQFGRRLSTTDHCPYTNCLLTADRSLLREADVLLFHYRDPPDWPARRYPHQYYAHFVHEPPGDRRWYSFINRYEARINVTINFRRDADLYVPYTVLLPTNDTGEYTVRIPLASKRKMVVWAVSHCKTSSQREDYVNQLAKYVDVDVYGRCGTHRCPRSRTSSCLQHFERTYKFYLAFENNICRDYITEKLFQPLEHELIPIVLGGGNYSRDAPAHSVIDARDFSSPKHLADFLIKLAADEERYYSYFRWKSHFKTLPMQSWFLCRLCEALHKNTFGHCPAKTHYADYWFGVDGEVCDNQLVPRMRKEGHW